MKILMITLMITLIILFTYSCNKKQKILNLNSDLDTDGYLIKKNILNEQKINLIHQLLSLIHISEPTRPY